MIKKSSNFFTFLMVSLSLIILQYSRAQNELVNADYNTTHKDGEPASSVLDFDGIDDYVELNGVSDHLVGLNGYTIEFWMKADKNDQTSSIRTSMFSINPITSNGNGLLIILGGANAQDGKVLVYDENTWGSNAEIISTQVVGDNDCHHIAYSRNNSTGSLYIDGVLAGTHNTSYSIQSSDKISLGQEWDDLATSPSPSQFYNGQMSDVRIWNYGRSQQDIQLDMNNVLLGTESGLIAYYKCNQGIPEGYNPSVNYITDNSVNGIHGNLINFTLNGTFSNWVTKTCQPVGIEDLLESMNFRIFPNPSSGQFIIEGPTLNNNPITYELYNLAGDLMSKGSFNTKTIINVSGFSSGSYLLNLNSRGCTVTHKIDVLK